MLYLENKLYDKKESSQTRYYYLRIKLTVSFLNWSQNMFCTLVFSEKLFLSGIFRLELNFIYRGI